MNGDKYSQEVVDGMKVIVCKLKQNPLGYTSVAYPTDELRMPDGSKNFRLMTQQWQKLLLIIS